MAVSVVARPSGELSAFNDDAPLFLAANEIRDTGLNPIWSSAATPVITDTDRTSSTDPTSNLYDGLGDLGSHGTGVSSATWAIVGSLLSCTLDSVLVVFSQSHGSAAINQVSIEVDDNGSFPAPVQLGLWNTPPVRSATSSLRLLHLNTTNVYNGCTHYRVRFTLASAQTTSPRVGELYLARRRQLSRQWNYGGDERPFGAIGDVFEGRARGLVNYERAYGFSDFEFNFSPSGGLNRDYYGLDDVQTWRDVYTDSRGGGHPVVYVPFPFTSTVTSTGGRTGTEAFMGLLEQGVRMPKLGPFEREARMKMLETIPFYRVEV